MANLEFRDNKAGFRYEALEDGELVSQIDYTIDGDVMTFTHTGTPPQHRGRRVVPLCPFTASFISLHAPDYDDIVVQRLH